MNAIYKKEIKSYFNSMTGYLFVGFFLALISLYHYVYNFANGLANYAYALDGVSIFFIFLVPVITMKSMAEEKKQKTDQLLFTSPVSPVEVILGKYFAMATLLIGVMVLICVQPFVMSKFGPVNLKGAYLSIVAFTLLGLAYLAIGLFISSVSENQIMAAVITFAVILFSCLIDAITNLFGTDAKTAWIVYSVIFILITVVTYILMKNIIVSACVFAVTEVTMAVIYALAPQVLEGSISKVFSWISVQGRLLNAFYGLFSLSDFVYLISVIVLFVFLTIQGAEKRRWS